MIKYYYCSVLPKKIKNTYYYIADEEVKIVDGDVFGAEI